MSEQSSSPPTSPTSTAPEGSVSERPDPSTGPPATRTRRLFKILKVSRIPGWTFGPILYGIGIIHSEALPKTMSGLIKAGVQTFALSAPLCIIVFGVNDVYDYESDVRNPRKQAEGLEGGILEPKFHPDVLKAAFASSAFVLAASAATGRPQNIAANAALIALGWQYSTRPLRLKEVPLVDSATNGLIVFLCWFSGFSSMGRSILEVPGKGYMMSLCTAGVHALGAVMDTESDRAAGQKTIAVVIGKRPTALLAAMCYYAANLTVDQNSIFGAYVRYSAVIMTIPVAKPNLSHQTFRAIVVYTFVMALTWLAVRAKEASNKLLKQ